MSASSPATPTVREPAPTVSETTTSSAAAPPLPASAGGARYSIDDLRALERQSAWAELAEHLDDIAPAARDSSWTALAARACTSVLEIPRGDPMQTVELAERYTTRFPSLLSSTSFVTQRARVGLAGFEHCFDVSRTNGADCRGRFLAYLRADKGDVDFAMKAGRLVLLKQAPYTAVSFFREAVIGRRAPPECGDRDLQRAIEAGVQAYERDPLYLVAQELRRLCPND